jgi:protein AATF/BFR2
MHVSCRIAPFRNKSIDKWQRKTQVTTGAAAMTGKLQAFNQVWLYS